MFGNVYDSDNRKFCLYVKITCKGKKKFRVFAEDYGKQFSKYADRDIYVNSDRTIYLSFPVSPKKLFVGVVNAENPADKDYTVLLMEGPLKSYNITIDDQTERFLNLAVPFCQMCGFKDPAPNGTMYSEGEFKIKYYPVITNHLTGEPMNTPARVGHETGIIEVSRAKFIRYTIPMRLIILLHEFGHKYRNPKIGLPISSEFGADVNALYPFLGEGFSAIDAICVFANVFYGAQTDGNRERMFKIMNYIEKFQRQEFAQLNS